MKRKTSGRVNPVQFRPTVRDEKVMAFLRDKNPVLKDADILRTAIVELARKQGLQSAVS